MSGFCQESCVHSPHTSWGDLGEKVSRHYVEQAIEALPKLCLGGLTELRVGVLVFGLHSAVGLPERSPVLWEEADLESS